MAKAEITARPSRLQTDCENCGKRFPHSPSRAARFCSYPCCAEYRKRTGELARPKTGVERPCETCGVVFISRPSQAGRFCSQPCMVRWRAKRQGAQRRRDDLRVTCACEFCGLQFQKLKSQLTGGRGRYCSRACHGSGSVRTQGRVSKVEEAFGAALVAAGLAPVSQHRVGRWLVDFYFPSFGLAVEFDGTYWHGTDAGRDRDKRKDKALASHKINVLRITERQWKQDPTGAVKAVCDRIARYKGLSHVDQIRSTGPRT